MLVNIFVFILGLTVGSFLNVCIYRLPREKSVILPRSFCPACATPIRFYDNLPVISYFLLGGKCRSCKKPISPRYPLVELLTGFLFLSIPVVLGLRISDFGFYASAVFICFLVISFFSDLETQLLPDSPAVLVIITGLLYNYLEGTLASSLWGLFWGAAILYLISFFGKLYYKKEVLGGGDMKLAAAFGAFFGWQGLLLSLFLGYLIGAVLALLLLATGRKKLDDYIPFAPALVLGAFITLYWGRQIIAFYVANSL